MRAVPPPPRAHAFRSAVIAALLALTVIAAPTPGAPTASAAGASSAREAAAVVVAVTQVADRQVDLAVRSSALGGRIVNVRLLTPDGWAPGGARKFPTLWLLHGCCGTAGYKSWTAYTDVAAIPSLRKALVVMPEAGYHGWYSDWWNYGSGGDPAWERFHTSELPSLLERGWGASSTRAIAGMSMGGHGALLYAARKQGMFKAAASYSGSVNPLLNSESVNRLMTIFAFQGNDPRRIWGDPARQRSNWQAHDPYYLANRLTSIPVYLSCGNGTAGPLDPVGSTSPTEADFNRQNYALTNRIRALGGTRLTTHLYGRGNHAWAYAKRELHLSLPMLLRAIGVSA
jgi:diacylglycerol O-acyltransferase/trehalose O-mycolyltransferase